MSDLNLLAKKGGVRYVAHTMYGKHYAMIDKIAQDLNVNKSHAIRLMIEYVSSADRMAEFAAWARDNPTTGG